MFDKICLESEQEELLVKLVEVSHDVPTGDREQFFYADAALPMILHPNLPSGQMLADIPDLLVLNDKQLIALRPQDETSGFFDIAPLGFRYYEYIQAKTVPPLQSVALRA